MPDGARFAKPLPIAVIGAGPVGLAEFGLMRRFHPMLSARLATVAHPLGVAALLATGGIAAPLFALLHGAGSGMMTIAKGALPLALFGAAGYGRRQGLLGVPQSVANAFAPLLFSLLLARFGPASLLASAALGLAACGALMSLPSGRGGVSRS